MRKSTQMTDARDRRDISPRTNRRKLDGTRIANSLAVEIRESVRVIEESKMRTTAQESSKKVSRRDFVGAAALTAGGVAAVHAGVAAAQEKKQASTVALDWKEVYYTNCPLVSASNVDQELASTRPHFSAMYVQSINEVIDIHASTQIHCHACRTNQIHLEVSRPQNQFV